jgi:hypothetical protein
MQNLNQQADIVRCECTWVQIRATPLFGYDMRTVAATNSMQHIRDERQVLAKFKVNRDVPSSFGEVLCLRVELFIKI